MNPESRLVLRAVRLLLCACTVDLETCVVQVTYNNMGCFYKSFGKLLACQLRLTS